MTTLTLRYIKGDFLVTGPDIEARKFVRVAPSGQELEDDSSSRLSHNGDREAYAGQKTLPRPNESLSLHFAEIRPLIDDPSVRMPADVALLSLLAAAVLGGGFLLWWPLRGL
jgi:hypothetical protein